MTSRLCVIARADFEKKTLVYYLDPKQNQNSPMETTYWVIWFGSNIELFVAMVFIYLIFQFRSFVPVSSYLITVGFRKEKMLSCLEYIAL